MYKRTYVRRSRYSIVRLLFAFCAASTIVFLLWIFLVKGSSSIKVSNPNPVLSAVKADTISVKTWTYNEFMIQLPDDWEQIKTTEEPRYRTYEWKSNKADLDNRWLMIYVDTIPDKKEVNRIMPLEVLGNKVKHGLVSETCRDFTALDKKVGERALETAPATWNGVNFTCDLAKRRNVTGTSTAGSGYAAKVPGTTKTHSYFFLYTDHTPKSEFTVFINALDSFEAR